MDDMEVKVIIEGGTVVKTTSSQSQLAGVSFFSAILWLMAALIIGSLTFRKIRLYVDAYRRRRYMKRYREYYGHQIPNDLYTQKDKVVYPESDDDLLGYSSDDSEYYISRNMGHMQQDMDANKKCDLQTCNETSTGTKPCLNGDKQVYSQENTEKKGTFTQQGETKAHIVTNKDTNEVYCDSVQKRQQQLEWLKAHEHEYIRGTENLLLGGMPFSYSPTQRCLES